MQRLFLFILFAFALTACGFHPQGQRTLATPLHRMNIQAADPYSFLVRNLQQYLKLSGVQLENDRSRADTVLSILQDETSQELLSVSSTQQTRQYNLRVTVSFDIEDSKGKIIVPTQTLSDTRVITMQSNQVLGSSNEANLYFQQIRRGLALAIINRIASREITRMINKEYTGRT
jgi:LPS-assembly lipoprotein